MTAFDSATAPLPGPGEFLSLEASAGTGKTWSAATLAARYVTEAAWPIDRVMVISFSRASTEELRDRVRDRLEESGSPLAVAALRDFDQAAIFTTHAFCDSMLRRLGVLVDHDPADRLVPNIADVTRREAAELFLARFGATGAPVRAADALRWAHEAERTPALPLVRPDSDPGAADFAAEVRDRVDRAKRQQGLYTYDDMLTRLRDALADEDTGEAARARLAATYPVVLVDEFQDTDPVQWEILAQAFLGRSALVVVGDPKQSIYGFRGADVHAYLQATRDRPHATLTVNRRSSPALVTAVTGLLADRPLGHPRIRVGPVETTPRTPRLVGADDTGWAAPIRLRVPQDDTPLAAADARDLVDADLAADVAALLGAGLGYAATPDAAPRPLTPADVAIVVSTNRRGQAILDRLARAGLPAVFTGAQSIFKSPAAADWLALLGAVAEPRTSRLRAAGLTGFVGWTLEDLVAATPDQLADLAQTIRRSGDLLAGPGPAALFEHLADQSGLAARLARRPDGGRLWTDTRQLADLLQQARRRDGLDARGLIAWLEARRRSAGTQADESTRRLETDAAAIRMLTVHQAKGLQFPVVYLPQAADHYPREPEPGEPFAFHDGSGARRLDLGTDRGLDRTERLRRHREDEDGERLRVLYVALTRAACHVTAWWAPTKANLESSALHRVLASRPGEPVPDRAPAAGHHPRDRSDLTGVLVEVMPAAAPTDRPASPTLPAGVPPRLRRFTRAIDQKWRRTSYTALTADSDHAHVEEGPLADESDVELEPAAAGGGEALGLDAPSPMADLVGGTAFGSLVHSVFEYADPRDRDQLAGVVRRATARAGLAGVDEATLLAALEPGLTTPLGPITDNLSLADIGLADRLAELDFELPLAARQDAGPTRRPTTLTDVADARPARRPATLADVADALDRHVPPDDPLAPYAGRLRSAGLGDQALLGFLTGSIDVVLRVGDPSRHVVVDYKTNRLAPPGQPLTLGLYTPARLAQAMMASHYPLQALLYSVALHRFLRWRQPGYDPASHLGGVAYLFVRGLAGPATPLVDGEPTGVFAWRPPVALIEDLDSLLAGRRP